MSPVLSIRGQTCPSPSCRDAARVTVHSRADRRFRCAACGSTWVEHRGALQYRLRQSDRVLGRIGYLVGAGMSVRATARALGISVGTVMRLRQRLRESAGA